MDLAFALMRDYLRDAGADIEYADGPHGWWNWRAELAGNPARDSTGEGIVLRPNWTEYALYSDARFAGELTAGPFRFLLAFSDTPDLVGRASLQLVLRMHDHLPEPDPAASDYTDERVDSYYGGHVDDELVALLALALGRRLRSGGIVRQAFAGRDPLGEPFEAQHHPPTLIPPRRQPILPGIAHPALLEDAHELLSLYPKLLGPDAVALVRAAQNYADALWLADADARLAWLKLVGAVETAAQHWKARAFESPAAQLKRHRRKVYNALQACSLEVLEAVADDLAPTFYAAQKFHQFLQTFDPGPPDERPLTALQVDWSRLDESLAQIYEYRSNELHRGLPFPAPLLEPPLPTGDLAPPERFPALAASTSGGSWPAERLPIYLHVFEYIVRGALQTWWASLPIDGFAT